MKLNNKIIFVLVTFLSALLLVQITEAKPISSSDFDGNGVGNNPGTNYYPPDEPSDKDNLPTYTLDTCNNESGGCFPGTGLRLRIVSYNGSGGDPVPVGDPVYVLHPDILQEVVITNGVDLPGSEAELGGGNYDLGQVNLAPKTLKPEDNYIVEQDKPKALVHQAGGTYKCRGETRDAVDNKYLRQKPHTVPINPAMSNYHEYNFDGFSYQYDTSQCNYLQANSTVPVDESNKKTFVPDVSLTYHAGYNRYTFTYMSGYRKTRYPKDMIRNLPSNYHLNSSLTKENMTQSFINTIVSQYAGTTANVKKFFNVDATGVAATDYYVEVQGIYRVALENPAPIYEGLFLVTSFDHITCEEQTLVKSGSTDDFTRGYSHNGEKYCTEEKPITSHGCFNGTTRDTSITKESDCKSPNEWKEYNTGKYYCPVANVRYYWTHENVYCGNQNFHKIYGRKLKGYSELRFTKATSTTSCDTGNATTSLADLQSEKRVRHCKLRNSSANYTQQELLNKCTNDADFQYYIGPDPQRALVGQIKKQI